MKTRILYSIACLLFPATISAQGFNVIQEKNITQLLSPKRNVWDENGKTIVLYNLRDVWMREDKDFPGKYHIIIDALGKQTKMDFLHCQSEKIVSSSQLILQFPSKYWKANIQNFQIQKSFPQDILYQT